MSAAVPDHVVFPWIRKRVPVDLTWSVKHGDENRAIAQMSCWSDSLRDAIEKACFAHYLEHVYAIDARPPVVPAITAPEQVWRHIDVKSVCPHGADVVVVYAIPEWDEDEQHEWCIRGTDELVYVGQVLCYDPAGYARVSAGNCARNYEDIIATLRHIPHTWTDA
ncbi:MAG: hypothetical protein AB2L07_09610 [Thermoanaerobaculaceae bacterium]